MRTYAKKQLFDVSDYPRESKYYNGPNNLVVVNMKDETWGRPPKDFLGLKSKIYTFITEHDHESEKRN